MGSEIIKKIVKKSLELKIKYLTFTVFLQRIGIEVKTKSYNLQSLLKYYLDSEIDKFYKRKDKVFIYW